MVITPEDNTNSTRLTNFDLLRLEDLEIGQDFRLECGNGRILRYRNDYTLLLFDDKVNKDYLEFKDKESLIEFLGRAE